MGSIKIKRIKKYRQMLLGTLVLCLMACLAAAANLLTVYQDAKYHDPTYQAAKQLWLARKEALPQGIALALPHVSAAFISLANNRNIRQGTTSATPNHYNEHAFSITLTQPIFDFSKIMTLKQANARVDAAAARFADAKENLILRTLTAYFHVLLAQDILRYSQANQRAHRSQLHEATRRHDVGLSAVTAVSQARAAFDSATSAVIGARMNLEKARQSLRQLTGKYYKHLTPLKNNIPLVSPNPIDIQRWVDAATRYNYLLNALRFDEKAARDNIGINFSGHLPVVNLTGDVTRHFSNGTTFNIDNFHYDALTKSIGVAVALPLFQGGAVLSRVRQAKHEYLRATDLMRVQFRRVVSQVFVNYFDIIHGIKKLRVDRRAVRSSRASVGSTEEAYDVGTNSLIDVLVMQRDLFSAEELYAYDEFNYVLASFNLKRAAGNLCEADLYRVNAWLK